MKYKIITLVGVLGVVVLLWLSNSIFVKTPPQIGSEEWINEKMKAYPEIAWLGGEGVRQTHDMQKGNMANNDQSPSFLLYGKKYPEFDRSVLSLMCLSWLIEGTESAYKAFTSAQKEPDKLSYDSFLNLHKRYAAMIASGVTHKDFEIALVLGDTGKTETARAYFKEITVSDHDEFLKEALQRDAALFPTFKELTPWAQEILPQVSGIIHFGHFLHLEGGIEMIMPLIESHIIERDPKALEFDFLVHIADVSGAGGHVNPTSSIVLTENVYKALMAMDTSLLLLKKEEMTAQDVLENYIKIRASWIGLASNTPEDRILTRLGAMIRLYEKTDGEILKSAFKKFDLTQQNLFIEMFDPLSPDLPSVTPTYIPAVFVNLYNNKSLGETPQERLTKTLDLGLPFVSHVLKIYQDQMSEGKMNINDPLNFNDIARVAKENPEALTTLPFFISPENNVMEKKDGTLSQGEK
ncbi:MAG: hypothetical protein JSS34_02335 [Proteobacteria bacterium]|nr:hypothetical protein [Pseudomonadota bacterium]